MDERMEGMGEKEIIKQKEGREGEPRGRIREERKMTEKEKGGRGR